MRLSLLKLRLLYGRQFSAVLAVALILCTVFGSAVFSPNKADAAAASTINFQARLMGIAGNVAADGNYNIEFKIYDTFNTGGTAQGVCTGNCKWMETRTGSDVVTVANGYVTVNLGSVTSFGAGINWDQDLWMTMRIGGTGSPSWDTEMSPRLKLTAVPYAFRAGQLAKLTGANTSTLTFDTQTGPRDIKLPDEDGVLCIRTSANCGFATGTAASYIQNGTTVQTGANFNIRSNAIGSVAGVLQGANGQTADLFDVQTWNGSVATTVFGVSNTGDLAVQNINVAANKGISLASGTGTYSQTYSNNTGVAATFAVTDSASSGATTVQGVAINLTGTNNAGGTNGISGLVFGNVAAATNNAFHGIDFGTGFTDLLRYNGTPLISGTGIVQSAAISGSYTGITGVGTLTAGALGSGFTTVAVGQGGTGATTFTSNGVLYGSGTGAIQATAAGTTGQCLMGNTSAAPGWASCDSQVTLQDAYDNSTSPELTLGSASTAGITIRDNATPISGNLLEIQNNAQTTTYLGLTSSALTLGNGVDFIAQGASAYISNSQDDFAGSEAFGLNATVSGAVNAVALGNGASALGSRSVALGRSANAGSDDGIALGDSSSLNGNGGIAIGANAAAGFGGIAIGYGSTAGTTGTPLNNAIAIRGVATANNQLVIGNDGGEITQVVIGSGVTDATPTGFTLQTTSGSGSNVAGASINIAGGQGTGSASGGNIVLQTASAGSSGSGLNGLTTRATFDTNNSLYLGNGVTAGTPNAFVISGTGSSTTGVAGGAITVQGGNATVGNANGGNITISGGTGFGTGVRGLVVLTTPTFSTTSNDANCYTGGALVASSCTITTNSVNNSSAIIIGFNQASQTASLPDPTTTTAGRVVYVTAANGSSDFTLSVNGGGTGNTITMKANTTATMIWNGADWTAAGASSSTDLQAAYNNTASTAGAAELVLKNTATSNGLTVRNGTGSDEITGALLEVQNSIGSSLFGVNNNATEYANNGGGESATFTMWTAAPAGGTANRYTTAGNLIATGQASVFADTTSTANTGVKNTLSSSLTQNLKYKISYAVRMSSTTSFTTLDTIFSSDGSATTATCTSGSTVSFNIWTRIDCTFTATSVGASNAIIIRHSDSVEHDFYIDNLSVTVSADVNHAVDGSADTGANIGGGTLNWAAVSGSTVSQTTSVLYDSSGAVSVATAATAGRGVYNKLSNNIAPSVSTQYRVAFYARGDGTNTATLGVTYTPDNGTNSVNCGDYNTQVAAASTYTLISCYFTTGATTVTNAQVRITQSSGSATTFYVDALTVTLNSNTSSNVQIGGANKGGPTTLLTLDRSNGAPIAANNDAYLGSLYYDTSSGRIQCYEADGWGACGAAPDNVVNLNPEYAGAVLNGGGIGTMTADFCANQSSISFQVNTTICSNNGEARNYYRWTSPQATEQTYSIYVTYQLPTTFNGFSSDDTIQLTARVDSTTNAAVTYQVYRSTGSTVSQCWNNVTAETTVATTNNTWQSVGINGNEATGCGFNSSAAGNFVIFKINMKAKSNANAYVSTLSFVTTGR